MTDLPTLLSSVEASEQLGISRSTLTQWMSKGWIVPAQQLVNGQYLFTQAEVDRASAADAEVQRARNARTPA